MKRAVLLLLAGLLSIPALAATEAGRGPIRNTSLDIANPNIQNRVHREGNVWLNVTNYGYFGNYSVAWDGAWGDPCPPGDWAPQGEYPGGSNQEYLFQGAVWIGALIQEDGEWVPRVSVGTDGWFNPSINELFPGEGEEDGIDERSNIPGRINCFGDGVYNPEADANEEFIATYSDSLMDDFWLVDDPVDGLHRPLGLRVTERSFAWNSLEYNDFVIFEYTLKNISPDTLRNVYLGLYVDGDVGNWDELEHHIDDITGFLAVDTLTGDTLNIAYIADNDGRPHDLVFPAPLEYPHVAGMSILATSQQDLTWSFNWWVSNGEVGDDYGPAWDVHCHSDSFAWTWVYGTPVGDARKYHLLSNGEHDFDQIYMDRIEEVPPQHVILPDGSEADREWCIGNEPENGDDLANGFDTRYLISCGPMGILDHVEPNGERVMRFDPGMEFSFTAAYVFGEYFHNPEHPQPSPGEIDPSLFDFTSLMHNTRRARELFESDYTFQPTVPPTNFHAAGVLSNAVPLGWLPPAGLLVEGYNIFGVDEAGVQTPFNSELVQGASYTVTGLENGGEWDFQIQTVAQGGIPSGYVTTRVRVGAPLPVVRLRASLDSSVVHLSWHANADPALTNYRVLRRSDVEGDSATIVTTAVNYDDFEAIVGRTYTYWVVAENSRGLQSFLSDSVVVVPWAPERRILVIDETDSLRGAQILQGGVSADSVAAVYRRLLDATGEAYDYIDQPDQDSPVYTLEMLAQYDVVIWHCESNASTYNLLAVPEREQILQDYIRNGGRMLRIARRLLSGQMAFPPGRYRREQLDQHPFGEYLWPLTFDSVHVADRYLTWQYGIRLTGGASPFPEFPDFVLDTARLHQIQFGGNPHFDFLPEIDVYWPRPETDPLYRAVVHESDTSGLANQPVAVMGYGEILLGFPLYFLHEEDAQAILTASIAWLRAYADVPEPEPVPIPTTLALQQNYPNPFNAATTLKFDLPEAARVQLVIYNLLGQEVRVLADQTMSAGYHTIHWDGSNASGFALPSGLYLARLETEQASQTVKIVLLR